MLIKELYTRSKTSSWMNVISVEATLQIIVPWKLYQEAPVPISLTTVGNG